jgi:dihydrofolate reductase
MRRLVLFMHTSLDGFVAGLNGEMDWINVNDEMFEYAGKQTDMTDTALYGGVTYQMMESYWPTAADQLNATKHDIQHSRWYNSVTKIVVSKTLHQDDLVNTEIISDNIVDEIKKIKQQPGKNILIFGSPSIVHQLIQDNLIDDYWLFVNPLLLGTGIPLFKNINHRINLKILENKVFASGVIVLHYERN